MDLQQPGALLPSRAGDLIRAHARLEAEGLSGSVRGRSMQAGTGPCVDSEIIKEVWFNPSPVPTLSSARLSTIKPLDAHTPYLDETKIMLVAISIGHSQPGFLHVCWAVGLAFVCAKRSRVFN